MRAMVLERIGEPLRLVERPDPAPADGEVRIASMPAACAEPIFTSSTANCQIRDCRSFPVMRSSGASTRSAAASAELDPASASACLGWTHLRALRLLRHRPGKPCDDPLFTGYSRDGGFATMPSPTRATPSRSESGEDVATAPLLCAGLIGWRSLRIAGDGWRVGLYGFGAAGPYPSPGRKLTGPRSVRLHPSGR